ncbi:ATP-binding cassette domain-containing protein [Wenzhouxiangella marina]|uniref:Probable ATP-binding protein YheS n=1 Tax=Wenzhouxiangella marina TaxID=1579979 RepID=A0A0K0XT84_9GAMM|nr:ATP-binding cassette domain-containing protein [Wenzhouxiangella marina]AKS40924.1 glutathione ABC transporter ATP-binding protein [Wenzhouxiangella marina]MBB6087798.1 ATP-binding cassette subfamily F protein 3 [Wenzhouxiangella marina]
MIQISDLTLRHGPEALLEHAEATIFPGHKVGLIGPNGCGKSSLFALLQGQLAADDGDVRIPAAWTLAAMAQEIKELDRPALDYVIDGDRRLRDAEARVRRTEAEGDGEAIAQAHAELDEAGGYTAAARAGSLLNGLGFKPEEHRKPVGDFSGGWRIRLSLARALMCPSDLLMLDEPTNHLDLETVVWLEDWLKRYAGTLIIISHDRDFLDQVVDSVLHIEHRRLVAYTGGYSDFERLRAERLAHQQARFEKQQREIAHMQSFIDRFRAKASKAKAAQSRIKALERMEQVAPAHADSPFHFEFPPPPKAANPLLSLDQVSLGYGSKRVLEGVSLSLAPGDRIGLLGLNGAGKSTLVRALAGELPPLDGRLTSSRGLQIGYFAQHQLEQLDGQASPLLHLQRLAPEASEQSLRDYLGGFDFHGDQATGPVAPLSGGEKARLVLALLVWQGPNLLLLDEPTNHLDLDMRHALTVALQGFEGAVVTVSHDRHLLTSTVEAYWLVADGQVRPFDGDLSDYRRWLSERNAPEKEDRQGGNERRETRRNQAERRERLRPLKNRVEKLTRQVDEASQRVAELERTLADAGLYEAERAGELAEVLTKQSEWRQRLEGLENDWMEAQEALDAAEAE